MEKYNFANLPTKITKLENFSKEMNANVWIKRDDQTGSEISGNKIRKLEYLAKDAKAKGYDTLITCGGIQSNHCRATVAVATMLGMKSAVLLRISDTPPVVGNYFIDKLLGAEVRFCTRPEYSNSRGEIMEEMAKEFEKQGHKAYIIPEGASNAIGTLGYYNCMNEILEQEKELGIKFDTIVVATGSGGTYAGLYVANEVMNLGKRVIGMAVCDDTNYFTEIAHNIGSEALQYLPEHKDKVLDKSHIEINDKYVGIGYALSRPEELEFIKKFARQECVILDQVYTGKAMYGLYNELQEGGNINGKDNNILFIHTGGLFGLFTISEDFPL